jgi:hypothetical protein
MEKYSNAQVIEIVQAVTGQKINVLPRPVARATSGQ